MTTETELNARSNSTCELCTATDALAIYEIPPTSDGSAEQTVLLCATCSEQVEAPAKMDPAHWQCLTDSMWTPVAAVQVMAWRMLDRLKSHAWAAEQLDLLYLDDETLAWAQAGAQPDAEDDDTPRHMDSNGAQLASGDTVHLIKDLNVKGAGFTAKRGTAVRNISLVLANERHIEGRINGQQIVILTEFVKKA